ncbi:MAG: hypothetical protein RIR62_1127 [Pseudomonadota bacterium]|jgi:hypothetical protein
MKLSHTTSALAIAALLATAGVAAADSITSAFEGSVSVLSPDQTGFIIGGQVSVNGLGSGALTMTRSLADMTLTGSASSDPDTFEGSINGADADASVLSVLNFSRDITTSGSLVGQGNVVSRGEAIAALGSAGAASASTSIAGVDDTGLDTGEGSATAEATSQGSLNGSLSTSNTLQLLGTSGLFAASNGLSVGETNLAVAYGSADVTANSELTGVQLTDAEWADLDPDQDVLMGARGDGALFIVTSDLNGDDEEIAMSVSNAGNGTVSITTSTGGFFTGGGAAGGSSSFVNNGSFFSAP